MTILSERSQAGFSLVETLVAFAILAIAILSSFHLLGDAIERVRRTETRQEFFASAREEAIRIQLTGRLPDQTGDPATTTGLKLTVSALPTGDGIPDGLRPFRVTFEEGDGAGTGPGAVVLDTIMLFPGEAP